MPPLQNLTRVTTGYVTALDLSGVADGTELNGWNHWQVYENGGPGNGFYEIRSGEIRQLASNTPQLALWGLPAVGLPGQCIAAEVYSTNWGDYHGLVVNGLLDHSDDIRAFFFNTWEIRHRSGTDYGQGFLVGTGTLTGQPFATGQWYPAKFGVVQDTGAVHPRVSGSFNGTIFQVDNTTSTGINSGTATYPGLISWANANEMRWRSLVITRDYRLSVQGLTGAQGFRLYNSSGSVLKSSGAQSSNAAQVNLIDLTWPITGYVQVFNDAGTWGDPVIDRGRYPDSGSTTFYGGDVLELPSIPQFIVQVNWDDTAAWPDFWTIPDTKDVTGRLVELHLKRAIANPELTVDTAEVVLDDPDGDYVPAKVDSAVYPNVRLGRKLRIAYSQGGTVYPLFYGEIAEYAPAFRRPKRYTTIRAESPLRRLQNAVFTAAPVIGSATVLVDDSGTAGAVPLILDSIDGGSAVPTLNRALAPDATQVQDVFSETWSDPSALFRELALLSQGYWYVQPLYRTLSGSPDWQFVWASGTALLGTATADFAWTSEEGDLDDLEITYSGDVI